MNCPDSGHTVPSCSATLLTFRHLKLPRPSRSVQNSPNMSLIVPISTHDIDTTKQDVHTGTVCNTGRESVKVPLRYHSV